MKKIVQIHSSLTAKHLTLLAFLCCFLLSQNAISQCAAGATTCIAADEYIKSVSMGTISNLNNGVEAGGYANDKAKTTTLTAGGASVTLTVTNGNNPVTTDQVSVWVDWNQNGSFADAGEQMVSGAGISSPLTYSTGISAPCTAKAGNCTMRIIIWDNGSTGPSAAGCGTVTYGEVEDYTIVVAAAAAPTVQSTSITFPSVGTTSASLSWTSGNGAYSIVVASTAPIAATPTNGTNYTSNATYGSGGTIGASQYVVYDGSGSSVTVTGLTAGTTYYFQVFDYNCGMTYMTSTATGNPASCTTHNALPAAGCTPTATNTASSEYISQVSLPGDAGSNFTNGVTGDNKYIDYSASQSVNLTGGNTYTVTVTNGLGYATDICNVWIDYNGNGSFTTGAETIKWTAFGTYMGAGATYAIVFTVPAAQATGDYRMRINIEDNHNPGGYTQLSNLGCGTCTYGETEDYNLHITAGCNPPTTQATAVTFSSVVCNQMNVSCTIGNGANRIIVASTSAIGSTPTSGTNYTANPIFGSGNTIGAGQYVVYNGSSNNVTVTGLTAGTTYYFKVFEYNCGTWQYYTGAGAGNPASQATGSAVTAASAGPNQFICASPATMAGNAPALGSGTWSIINPTGSPAVITTPSSNTTTVTGIPASSYVTLRWTVSGGGCASSSDDVVIRTQ